MTQTATEPSEVQMGRDRDAWPDYNRQTTTQTANWGLGMMSSPEVIAENKRINKALTEAVDRVKAMTPRELEAMKKAQRESWTRQDND